MLYLIVIVVLLAVLLLTVLPGWLRKRRLGEDFDVGADQQLTMAERRQKIRDWDELDHPHRHSERGW